MNGGMLRCFHILEQLCKHFQVTALMMQDKESFLKATEEYPAIKNCKLLSTEDNQEVKDIFSLLPVKYRNAGRFRFWNRSLSEPAENNYLVLYPQLKDFLKTKRVDFIILEDMAILNLAKLIKRFQPSIPVIYDAYNINSILAASAFKKGVIGERQYKGIFKTESTLHNLVKNVFTCSEADLDKIMEMNHNKIQGAVIPNGVSIPSESLNEGWGSMNILFCGSLDYLPNQEGLLWFCRDVFPLILRQLPVAKLLVVGKGNPGESLSVFLDHPSVINYGQVDKVDKYYRKSAMAIVPLLSGSGTRLKLLEAMSLKVPVVSTKPGAEGINYSDMKNILIAEGIEFFANGVIEILSNPPMAKSIAENAFKFVQNEYDWNIVGEKIYKYLNTLN